MLKKVLRPQLVIRLTSVILIATSVYPALIVATSVEAESNQVNTSLLSNGDAQARSTQGSAGVQPTLVRANVPTVKTNAASGATPNGNLTSKSSASSVAVFFEYGLTTSYGTTVVGVPSSLTSPRVLCPQH